MHTPVLLKEVVENLQIKEDGLYIDATLGEAGYTKEILNRKGRVLAIDWDENQVKSLKSEIQSHKNLIVVVANFANIESIAKQHNFYPVNGVVFDLGLSMQQLMHSGRGFSYNLPHEPLDMRINLGLEKKASDLINSLEEKDLYEIFAKYSEEIYSGTITDALVRARKIKRVEKVGDLVHIIDQTIGKKDKKVYARIFQALRIAVNNELYNLKQALTGAINILKKDGRILIISFHSIEDRIIKRFVKEHSLHFLHKKVIRGDRSLSFARSAKLRVIIK